MTKAEARKIVAYLVAAFPQPEVPESTVELYVRELQDLDFADCQDAAQEAVRTSKFFPRVADLFSFCNLRQWVREAEARRVLREAEEAAYLAALPPALTPEEEAQERANIAAFAREFRRRMALKSRPEPAWMRDTSPTTTFTAPTEPGLFAIHKREQLERLRNAFPEEFEPTTSFNGEGR